MRPLYRLFVNKWYFDELIDLRRRAPRAAWFGRFAQQNTFERMFVNGTARRRHDRARARRLGRRARAQTGFLRYYAALLVLGVAGVGFYFLLQRA